MSVTALVRAPRFEAPLLLTICVPVLLTGAPSRTRPLEVTLDDNLFAQRHLPAPLLARLG